MKHPLTEWREQQTPLVTQQKFADRVGVKSKTNISRIENWIRPPALSLAVKISEETGIPVDRLVKQDEAAQ